jgi:hypothetical protein
VLGGQQRNAADLQVATSLRLLWTPEDVQSLLAGRPFEQLTFRWFEPLPGRVPTRALPAGAIPLTAARARRRGDAPGS